MSDLRMFALLAALTFISACRANADVTLPLTCSEVRNKDIVRARCIPKGVSSYVGDVRCVPFSMPARMTGLWDTGFETSTFYEDGDNHQKVGAYLQDDTPEPLPLREALPLSSNQIRRYQIEFIGRRSLCPFAFGNGASSHEVIVEKFISLKPVRL